MKKGTILASVVFVALLIGAALSLSRKPERGITRLSFATIDKAGIDKLQITGPNPVELQKKDGKWVLANGKEADQTAVQNALDAIPKIDSSDLVTRSSERFAEYEVDDAKGTKLVAWAGAQKVAEAVVGKAGGSGTFVRSGGAVYSVRGVSSYLFSKPVSSWMQLKIFADAFDDVSRLEVALHGQPPYALVKKESDWQLEDPSVAPAGFRFDKNVARTLVSSVVNLRAKEFVDADPGAEATGLEQADLFAFVGKDGARRELKLGKAREDKSLFARAAGHDDLFVVQEYSGRALRKGLADLREMTLMKLETEKAAKLAIRDGKTELVFEKQGADWKIGRSTEVVPKDFELDPAAVLRRLNAVKNARALSITDPGATSGAWKPSGTVTVTFEDGTNATLAFGAATKHEEQDAYLARGNADSETYVVTKYLRDDTLRGLQSFKKVAQQMPPQIDPSALDQLPPEVRKSLQEQIARQQQMQQMQQMMEKAKESK
mgnify:CR=1 FL=1